MQVDVMHCLKQVSESSNITVCFREQVLNSAVNLLWPQALGLSLGRREGDTRNNNSS